MIEPKQADPNYARLAAVLNAAYSQAAHGKGKERHANGLPYDKQPMQSISHLLRSERGMAYQVIKKLTEGLGLPTHERRVAELLGAINYLAGIVIYLEDTKGAEPAEAPAMRVDPTVSLPPVKGFNVKGGQRFIEPGEALGCNERGELVRCGDYPELAIKPLGVAAEQLHGPTAHLHDGRFYNESPWQRVVNAVFGDKQNGTS